MPTYTNSVCVCVCGTYGRCVDAQLSGQDQEGFAQRVDVHLWRETTLESPSGVSGLMTVPPCVSSPCEAATETNLIYGSNDTGYDRCFIVNQPE